ncbi:MAG: hypothetical protein Q4A78_05755 [Peptostreptococcaceae bacterium]|nr:hypothetical protein [Peptostreptococcaceae bacterium]
MKFLITEEECKNIGCPYYTKEEYSFNFEPRLAASVSILVGDVHISFFYSKARQISGYNPYLGWIKKDLTVPEAPQGVLRLEEEPDEDERIEGSKTWKTFFDPKTGWVCIGNEDISMEMEAVEFATNTIAVISHGKLISIWVKPDMR